MGIGYPHSIMAQPFFLFPSQQLSFVQFNLFIHIFYCCTVQVLHVACAAVASFCVLDSLAVDSLTIPLVFRSCMRRGVLCPPQPLARLCIKIDASLTYRKNLCCLFIFRLTLLSIFSFFVRAGFSNLWVAVSA